MKLQKYLAISLVRSGRGESIALDMLDIGKESEVELEFESIFQDDLPPF